VTIGDAPSVRVGPPSAPTASAEGVPLWERAFAWIGLLLATGGFIPTVEWLLRIRPSDLLGGDPLVQVIWGGVYALAAALLFARLPRVARLLPGLGTLWIILFLAVVSSQWSAAPSVTLRRAIALLGTTVFALYLGTRFSRHALFRLLFSVFSVVVILSLVTGALKIGAAPGTWQGLFTTKNLLGQAMVCSAIVSLLFGASETGRRRVWGGLIFVLSCALLLLSDSKTSLVVLLAAMALLLPLRLLRLPHRVSELAVSSTLVAAGAAAVWIAGNSAAVFNLLGRDATLTGRVQLWEMLWGMIQRHPWLGYGYGGFWLYWDGPSAEIWKVCLIRYGWLPPNGHDGFLDLWLDLGLVGLAAFLVSLFVSIARAVRLAHASRRFDDLFPTMLLYFTILANLTESALVTHNSLVWVLLVATTMHLWINSRRPGQLPAPDLG
jgi:exopolysaccharide production protein ExoQ